MAIYPPMAFGISIIAFTLQLVREKDAVFQLASTNHVGKHSLHSLHTIRGLC